MTPTAPVPEQCPARRRAIVAVLLLSCCANAPGVFAADTPIVTAADAAKHVGDVVAIEVEVSRVKHAPRRKLHFLYSATNFRSDQHIPIAISEGDWPSFHTEGTRSIEDRYLDCTVRATGRLVRSEGQYLLMVDSPKRIEPIADAGAVPQRRSLIIDVESGERIEFGLPLAAELPRERVTIEHEGERETYSGVPLAALLAEAHVAMGADARGPLLKRYALVRSTDGYEALFSLAEVDPYLSGDVVLLAESRNDRPLQAGEGPMLVITADKRQRRWIRSVANVSVGSADAASTKRGESRNADACSME